MLRKSDAAKLRVTPAYFLVYGLYEFAYPYQYTLPCGGMARDEGLQAGILPFVPVLAAYDVRQ